jgi:hypothetical protein
MKPMPGWYPVKLEFPLRGEAIMYWQDLSAADFSVPFFEDAVRQARYQRPALRETSLHELSEISLPAAVAPTAFIFHTSRSGSTLLTQLLSCLDGSIVLSEPPIVDEVLLLTLPDEEKVQLLRQVLRTLGQARSGEDRHFFIKYDSWNLPWLPLIREAFPAVPCFFIYRRPIEILWSHHRQRGSQMVPGLRDLMHLNIELDRFPPADLDAFAAGVLESIFTQALPHVQRGNLIPLVYHRLVESAEVDMMNCLGIVLSGGERERMCRRSRFHSKRTSDPYHPEVELRIPTAVRERLEELADPILMLTYSRILALTQGGDGVTKL